MGYSRVSEDEQSICYYTSDGERAKPFFCINVDREHRQNGSRIAFRAADRDDVDRLAVRTSGATAFEPPHVCEEYTPFYYATFFEDAEGNKLEICFRERPPD